MNDLDALCGRMGDREPATATAGALLTPASGPREVRPVPPSASRTPGMADASTLRDALLAVANDAGIHSERVRATLGTAAAPPPQSAAGYDFIGPSGLGGMRSGPAGTRYDRLGSGFSVPGTGTQADELPGAAAVMLPAYSVMQSLQHSLLSV